MHLKVFLPFISIAYLTRLVLAAAEEAANSGSETANQQSYAEQAATVDIANSVMAKVVFPKGERLFFERPTPIEIYLTNRAPVDIYVVGFTPSYPKHKNIPLKPIRSVLQLKENEEVKEEISFTCVYEAKGKLEFALALQLFNPKDEKKPIVVPIYSELLSVEKSSNEFTDLKAIGIYAMMAFLGYLGYVYLSAKRAAKTASKWKKEGKSRPASPTEIDTDWIPEHHLKPPGMGKRKFATSREGRSSDSLEASELSPEPSK